MKKILILFCLCFTGYALAQPTITTINSTATIVDGISISLIQSMDFGTLIASAASGYVDLVADGETLTTSKVQHITQKAAGLCLALFNVTGQGNTSYSIALPQSVSLSNSAKNANMSITSFNYLTLNAGLGTPNLGNLGADVLLVGARLTVDSNQESGDYTGTFDVTVSYE